MGDGLGLSVYFKAEIDGLRLGDWTTCHGLGISIDTQPRGDTAMSFLMHHLPGSVKFDHVTLGRPVSPETDTVVSWISAFSMMPIPTVAQITAMDTDGTDIMTFALVGVIPVRWTGPSFDASSLKVAEEQLTIAYKGFL
jgi:phage tail-like protein